MIPSPASISLSGPAAVPGQRLPYLPDETARRDLSERELFSSVIARASRAPGASKEADARAAAQSLVSTALVQPIFKQLRESASAAPPPFGPGPGERSFRGMLDATMAQKLVTSQNWPLVDRLARDLLKKSSGSSVDASLAPSKDPAAAITSRPLAALPPSDSPR